MIKWFKAKGEYKSKYKINPSNLSLKVFLHTDGEVSISTKSKGEAFCVLTNFNRKRLIKLLQKGR